MTNRVLHAALRAGWLFALAALIAGAQEGTAAAAPERPTAAPVAEGAAPDAEGVNPEKRRRVVEVAAYLLVAVAVAGFLILALLVLWGARVRRMARRPLPRVSPVDELWYLRPKPGAASPNPPTGRGAEDSPEP